MQTAVVIPTAGQGRRMRSYGTRALLKLSDGRTLLRGQLDVVKAVMPEADIVVVVGFEGDRVLRTLPSNVRVVENENFEQTSVSRSVSMGLRAVTASRVLVMYGDLVVPKATLETLPQDRSAVIVDSTGRSGKGEVGAVVVDGYAVHFDFGLEAKWQQIALLTGRELTLFRQLGLKPEYRTRLGHELLNEVLERGGEFLAVETPAGIIEIDSFRDLSAARARGVK